MLRPKHWVIILLVLSLLGAMSLAQNKEKIKLLMPTHKGTTGLFNLSVADTLRPGEFALGLNAHSFMRDPGDLNYTIFPVSFSVGVHKRIELFASMEAYKRVDADDIVVNKILPGGKLVPAVLENGYAGGVVGYYNESPFMDTGFGDGTGDLWAGMKINLLSERYGNKFGFALQPIAKFHVTSERQHLVRGLTSGATDVGFDAIISKYFGQGGTVTSNFGFMFAGDMTGINRQNSFNWGGGFEYPLGTPKVNLVGELVGHYFFGGEDPYETINNQDPVDVYAGLRSYPMKWMSLTGAANYHLTGTDVVGVQDASCLGFYVQAAFKRVINEPPTVQCSAPKGTVAEGESAVVNAAMSDPDDDNLTVTWKSSGGRLSQGDGSATLDTTGLAPGRYSVMAEASDGENVASCSSDIVVEKRKAAPTIVCEPSAVSITAGDSASLKAKASDANGDALTYAWTVDGQSVSNNAPEFQFGSTGKTDGRHTVRVTVTDVDNMSASCEYTVTINRKPNLNPTCSLSLSAAQVFAGQAVTATGRVSDPDNDSLTIAWKVDGQARSESGSALQINTAGMTGGQHSVVLSATDARGGSCSDTKSFSVVEKIIIPMDKIKPDNKAKARLDEIALKMQQTPGLRARVTGYADSQGSAKAIEKAAQGRADSVKDYLVKQHKLDAGRIEAKSGGATNPIGDNSTAEGRKQNRRVEVELYVP